MGIARSGIGWMIARFGALGITWLASLYFVRTLVDPQEALGTYYAFETIVSFIVLFANGGLNGGIVKRVSEGEEPGAFATAGLLMSGALVILVSVITLLASPYLIDFFGYGGLSVVFVVGALITNQVRDTVGSALLRSNFNVGRSGVVDFADAIGQVTVQVGMIVAGFGAMALLTGYLIGSTVAAVVAVVLVVPRFDFEWPSKRHFRSLIQFSKYSFGSNFVQKFYDNIDIIVITIFLGKAATGVYGIGFRFSMLLTIFYGAINRTSDPEISKNDTEGDNDRIKEVLSDSIILGLLISLPAFTGFLILANPIIETFYTAEFSAATIVAIWAVATRIPEGLQATVGTVLTGMDHPNVDFRGSIILLIANLVLNLILVPTIGVVGAIIASFIGMNLKLTYTWYHLQDILELKYADLPLSEVSSEIVAALIMAGAVYLARELVGSTTSISVSMLVLFGVLVYFTIIATISGSIRSRLFAIVSDLIPENNNIMESK